MPQTNGSTAGTVSVRPAAPAAPAASVAPAAAPVASEPNLRAFGKLSLTDLGDKGQAPSPETAQPAAPAAPASGPLQQAKPGEPAAPAVVSAEKGKPADAQTPPVLATVAPAVLKTKSGREFKDPTELLTAYENSSVEALRLAAYEKTAKLTLDDMGSKLQAANNALLELQSVAGNGLFPGLKSTEELEAMPEEDRQNYYLDKRDWSKKQEDLKSRVAVAKEESEKFAVRVQEEMVRNDQIMASDPEKFPDYAQLEPLRAEILTKSPHLANRPDSSYTAWVMAMGLSKLQEMAQVKSMETKARADAATKAAAASATAAIAAAPPAGREVASAPKSTGYEKLAEISERKRSAY